jgi:GntR family transcriptional regulator, transcriptional repressor for pyruvate dehydrogenase complex
MSRLDLSSTPQSTTSTEQISEHEDAEVNMNRPYQIGPFENRSDQQDRAGSTQKVADRNPLARTIARRIEGMFAGEQGADRIRLPSERELSSRFGVSRASIREALSILEVSGKLRTEPSRGSFWTADTGRSRPGSFAAVGGRVDETPLWSRTYPKTEISRFRYLIEGQSGRLAAMRITDEEVRQLEKNLLLFKEQTRAMDLEASARTDFEFHQLIVEFSRVRLFADLHLGFREIIMQAVQMYRSQYNRAWEPVVEHEKILEALKRRDPDEALYYLQSHIVRSAERLGIFDSSEIL